MENNKKDNPVEVSTLFTEVLNINYKLGKIESKLVMLEKLIYIILTSILALLVKVFLL
jgi:hypothetical protein